MMERKSHRTLSRVLLVCLTALLATGCARQGATVVPSATPTDPIPVSGKDFVATVYPSDSVKTIQEWGLEEGAYIRSNRGSASYIGNSGHLEPSLVISPYYTLTINGKDVPVYATVVYVGRDGECALHSFAIIEGMQSDSMAFDVALMALRYPLRSAAILPARRNAKAAIQGDTVETTITACGDYSFLVNDEEEDASQYNAFTLFVRDYVDEDKEIAAYKEAYGDENVTVFEPGTHLVNYIDITRNDSVLYFRRGSLLIAKGNPSYGQKTPYSEPGATSRNGWGLDRYPLINIYQAQNIHIAGNGTIDAGQLGWHERRGILAASVSGLDISGLTLLNFPEWALSTYMATDVRIKDVRIFGYKTNSDGIAICNSTSVTVDDCFARSGDDLFEVKTLGAAAPGVSKDVVFTGCTAWASKARCFGVIWELSRDISDIVFRDCAVVYRDATWDNGILGSLVVVCGAGGGNVTDVTFENIEIHHDLGRAILVAITGENQTSTHVTGITFRNVSYHSDLPNLFKTRETGTNRIEAVFENVTGNGVLLTEETSMDLQKTDTQTELIFRNGERK